LEEVLLQCNDWFGYWDCLGIIIFFVGNQLVTWLNKWLYFIKHLENFENIPEIFKDEVFILAFKKAEIAKFSESDRKKYEESLKAYRDLKNTIDTAFDDGKIEVAKKLKYLGVSIEIIAQSTGLTDDEIKKL
jgi:predicted transposase/invertase (TIGR01784 family)